MTNGYEVGDRHKSAHRIGDRVGLRDGIFHDEPINPWYSTTGTVGTVVRIDNCRCIKVEWDNKEDNHYADTHLIPMYEPIMDVEELFAEVVL